MMGGAAGMNKPRNPSPCPSPYGRGDAITTGTPDSLSHRERAGVRGYGARD